MAAAATAAAATAGAAAADCVLRQCGLPAAANLCGAVGLSDLVPLACFVALDAVHRGKGMRSINGTLFNVVGKY